MKEKLVTILLTIFVSIISCLVVLKVQTPKEKNLAYIDTVQLFGEFEMKKELEKKLNDQEMVYQMGLDSIKLELNGMYQILEQTPENGRQDLVKRIKTAQYILDNKQQEYNEASFSLRETYNEQIQNQLNTYIKEFGKAKGYDFLLGANGQGNILFSQEVYDQTIPAIEYVNNKYSGEEN